MKYRAVTYIDGKPAFGEWGTFTEAQADARTSQEFAWVENENHERVTAGDMRIRETDQLNAADIYSAARRVVSDGTAAKLIDAINRAERGE
jgi:hypothetical protein